MKTNQICYGICGLALLTFTFLLVRKLDSDGAKEVTIKLIENAAPIANIFRKED